MKAAEITVGGIFLMKVSGNVVPVKVLRISESSNYEGRSTTTYICQNTVTGRECRARSAAKFRKEVKPAPAITAVTVEWDRIENAKTQEVL